MGILLIIIFTLLLFGWSSFLWFYRDRHTEPIEPKLEEVFDPRCLPITLTHAEKPSKAIVMIHGYPSSPAAFDWVAHKAFEEGYDVFVPLLPGFGTKVEHLYNTTFTQWFNYVDMFYREKREEYETLFVVGTSMGGAMTLKLGELYSNTPLEPTALATVAAPLFLNDLRLGAIQRFSYYLMRIVALFTPAIKAEVFRGGERENDGEELWVGYKGAFVRGGVSFMYALKEIRKEIKKITVPLVAMHDKRDKTIHFKNLEEIEMGVNSKRLLIIPTNMQSEHNRHILLMYPSIQEELAAKMFEFFTSVGEKR